ncbi:TetR/AcrR family transcriptional regulator [Massilia sp. MS-15]|uniref:TetR/AcrR family transcriptional regulator n=1 Tax=Massilia sp. MS-15 TaxID=2878200 RepID=UPI001CD73F4B|nr:TetR/AcrR family transcriptional regulator [Massilia sp. MS-15]MCA1246473.1 TetR/AcrR family transcriptional regulator [Massilia sp. MS-15]
MKAELNHSRSYRGLTQDERRAERRARLVTAAIAVYGERGYHQATVKAVCEAAGLTERYFYESFVNSEALLIDSFNLVTYSVLGDVKRAAREAGRGRVARLRAMLHAYFSSLQREPQSARVFLVEIRGVSRAVDLAFDAALRAIGHEVARIVAPPGQPGDELLQAGVVGGVMHIALRWIDAGYRPGIESVVDSALQLGMLLSARPARGARARAAGALTAPAPSA